VNKNINHLWYLDKGLNEEPAPIARVALVSEESWPEPMTEWISTATFSVQPAEALATATAAAQPRIDWAPECAFSVEIVHLPSSHPIRKHNKDHETDFTGRGRPE
jgi:hypothetical protein